MSWNYAVVRKRHPQSGDFFYAVHEVFYDNEDRIWACTEEPATPTGISLSELRKEMLDHVATLIRTCNEDDCTCGCVADYDLIPEQGAIHPATDIDPEDCDTISIDWKKKWLPYTAECVCSHCTHWHKVGQYAGECHARPLMVRDKNFDQRKRYATTIDSDWCARFEEK